jgi:hypothetical protein
MIPLVQYQVPFERFAAVRGTMAGRTCVQLKGTITHRIAETTHLAFASLSKKSNNGASFFLIVGFCGRLTALASWVGWIGGNEELLARSIVA